MFSVISIIFFFIAMGFPTLFATISSNETDIQALLSIKNHIQNDPLQILSSWNTSQHLCNWHGITCGRRHRRVTILNVSALQLVGSLPPSIGNLTFLREINLQDNLFHGIIPPEIGRLIRLRYLYFANNSFQEQFPTNLTRCKKLRIIDLRGNKLTGRIPDLLSVLSDLYALSLSRNNFSGSIPPSLGNISTLGILSLSKNNLTGNIPYNLGKLSNLHVLQLSSNKLSGFIPIEIYNISSINILSITNNFLTGQFPDNLGLTLPIITLFLAGLNNFTGSIPSTLANATDLVKISIGQNTLTGPIPRNLGRLKQLQVLHFGDNPLGFNTDNDASFIGTLTNCTNLDVLSLSQNEIGGVLPMEMANLSTTLEYLWINDNYITGSLPERVGELSGLTYLDVRGNNLSGNIPVSISRLLNMQVLHLSENSFTGEIPFCIGDISTLEILDINQNMLTGNIPDSISNFTQLLSLDLSQNYLTGEINKGVFNLTSLSRWLVLARNKFTGSVPLEVGNLKNIVSLIISENELSGEIPMSIGGCEMLENLEMEDNFLNGRIPSSLGRLKSIEVINLSRNKLSGKIPESLEKLDFLSFLNLSFNMLEGEVPKNGVFINPGALFLMGNEKLCGGIKSLSLPLCPKDSKQHGKFPKNIIIILAICIPLSLVSLLGSIYTLFYRKRSKRVTSSTSPDKKILQVSYAEILTSTNGFSSENLIGEGKYGYVYRGVLKPDEKIVAIKVLKLQMKGAHKSFLAECEAYRNIRHRNLIKIITSCSSIDFKGNDFKALIMEFAPNGSLEVWLHQNSSVQSNEEGLDFLERLNIAIDIATALYYFHNHSGNPIVHCDIKPSNVLLGNDLHGLVSDFGLAKFLPATKDKSHLKESNSIGIRGTIGYIAPEYGMGGEVSIKGDIYSYGILLLEMFTGKRPTDNMFTEDFSLHNYVKIALPKHVAEIIDPQLLIVKKFAGNNKSHITSSIVSCCTSIFRIGVSCSAEMQNDRMDINVALTELQHIRDEV